jgi:regulator of sigma E protease
MEIVIKIAQFLLSLSILIILHELGHFLLAKLFKARVEKFYLFFNPGFSLFKIKRGETEYGVGWLPLGGFVKISGMIDESMDREQMKKPPQPYEFRSKPAWQRLFIMLGGVLMNFLLAIIIYASVLYVWGDQYLPAENVKYGIMVDSLAESIGLQDGDKIISVDQEKVKEFHSIVPKIVFSEASNIQVKRGDSLVNVKVPETLIAKLIKRQSIGFIAPRIPFIVDKFSKESAAEKAGFQTGDSLVAFNGEKAIFYNQVKEKLEEHKNQKVTITVARSGSLVDIPVIIPESAKLGVYLKANLDRFFELKKIRYGFWESIPAGIHMGIETMDSYIKNLKLLFKPKTKAYESLGGFITIGSIFPGQWDWQSFWTLTAFLSIILAIMNILPIPALDGGHVMFVVFEMVTGRKPSDRFLEIAQIIGFVILISLLIYANANDIIRLFNK